jgi:hypothetical protein
MSLNVSPGDNVATLAADLRRLATLIEEAVAADLPVEFLVKPGLGDAVAASTEDLRKTFGLDADDRYVLGTLLRPIPRRGGHR